MFRLYDKTRRRICLTGFVMLCIVPTVAVAAWCVARHLPSHRHAEMALLGRQLGLSVSIDRLVHLRPSAVLYEGFELADPETEQTVLRCRVLEAGWADRTNQQGQHRRTLVLTASQPETETAGLDQLRQLLQRVLQGQTAGPVVDVQCSAAEATLPAGENSQTLTNLDGRVETLAGGVQVQLDFRLAGVEMSEPARLRLVRNRQTTPATSGFEFSSGNGEIPCSLLALGMADAAALGPQCRFRGAVWASQTPDGWTGEINGQLSDIELGRLVSEHFPHKLSGTGELSIQSARFRNGRVEEAAGELLAGPGVIGRSLLASAVARLGLVPDAEPDAGGEAVSYEQLALAFRLDASGLRLQGRCAAAGSGAILGQGRHRLLGQPDSQPLPVVALVRMLVPQSEVQVPATRQTDWLLRHLPVPQVVPPGGGDVASPHGQLRLGRRP